MFANAVKKVVRLKSKSKLGGKGRECVYMRGEADAVSPSLFPFFSKNRFFHCFFLSLLLLLKLLLRGEVLACVYS